MWISVTLDAASDQAEALSEALMDAGALSVSIEDAAAGTAAERAQFGEPGHYPVKLWERSRVAALFDADADAGTAVGLAARAVGLEHPPAYSIAPIAEQNWVELTQSQFDPIRVTGRMWIVPSWHTAPDPEAINIALDPGMAFGTGSHPTTRLCLEWLCNTVRRDSSVLDYGCGSGILGIAAAKLGAARVVGVDVDENAVEAARYNIERNHVSMQVQTSDDALTTRFDIVVANILTNPLCVLAPLLSARLAPDGRIALSGVLARQAGQVIEAYAPFIALGIGDELDGWVRLEGRLPAAEQEHVP